MTQDTLSALMRSATEDDVLKALEGSSLQLPLSAPADLLEFHHLMLDLLMRVGEEAAAADRCKIPVGFGSTD